MALTLRGTKGSTLSWAEMDANLQFLEGTYGGSDAVSGYWYRFPNGIILQVMRGMLPQGQVSTVTFPTTFPTECLIILVSKGALLNYPGEFTVGADPISRSQANIGNTGPSTGVMQGGFILAIGY